MFSDPFDLLALSEASPSSAATSYEVRTSFITPKTHVFSIYTWIKLPLGVVVVKWQK